jgi:phosphoglycerol transferase MdoB-like AlkP superfamily enzyme
MGVSMMGFYIGSELRFSNIKHLLVLIPALMAFVLTIKRFRTRHFFLIIAMVSFLGVSSMAFVLSILHWPGVSFFSILQIPFLGFVVVSFILWAIKQKLKPLLLVHLFLMGGFVLNMANFMFSLGLGNTVWTVSLLSFVATLWHLNDFNRWEQQKIKKKEEISL